MYLFHIKVATPHFCRYSPEENEEPDETGWKLIHADVFRFPAYPSLFCAMLGCGVQLYLIFLSMLSLSVLGVFYAYGRGTMYATIIVIYSQTSIVAGYVSGSYYKKVKGEQWVHNVFVTCSLFVVPVFFIWTILNSIAWAKGSTSALPAGTVLGLFALFLLVAFPLTLAGMSLGGSTPPPFHHRSNLRQEHRRFAGPPLQNKAGEAPDPRRTLVEGLLLPRRSGRVPPVLCDLRGAVLRLHVALGTPALHTVLDSVLGVRNSAVGMAPFA